MSRRPDADRMIVAWFISTLIAAAAIGLLYSRINPEQAMYICVGLNMAGFMFAYFT